MLQTLQSCAERHPLQERGAHQGTPESTAETEQEAAALQPKQETAAKSRDCSKSKQLKLEQATELKQEAADLPAATALRLPVAQAKRHQSGRHKTATGHEAKARGCSPEPKHERRQSGRHSGRAVALGTLKCSCLLSAAGLEPLSSTAYIRGNAI